jgi:hypothetical protein
MVGCEIQVRSRLGGRDPEAIFPQHWPYRTGAPHLMLAP